MWQRAFVLEYLPKVAHIDLAVALWAADEVFGFVLRRPADAFTDVLAARDAHHISRL
jgi:hypothetical protein